MLKKQGLLSWFDKKIKTKEDFQVLIMALFIAFIIFIKCYLAIHPYIAPTLTTQNRVSALKPAP